MSVKVLGRIRRCGCGERKKERKKNWVCYKCKELCTKYRLGGVKLGVYLQIIMCKTLPTQLAS